MLRAVLLVSSLLLAAACGKPASAGETAPDNRVAAEEVTCTPDPLLAARDAACGCTDQACADRIAPEVTAARARAADLLEQADECLARHLPNLGDQMLREMQQTRDAICACRDRACVDQAEEAFMRYAMKVMKEAKNFQPTKAQDMRADQLQDEMKACKDRLAP